MTETNDDIREAIKQVVAKLAIGPGMQTLNEATAYGFADALVPVFVEHYAKLAGAETELKSDPVVDGDEVGSIFVRIPVFRTYDSDGWEHSGGEYTYYTAGALEVIGDTMSDTIRNLVGAELEVGDFFADFPGNELSKRYPFTPETEEEKNAREDSKFILNFDQN